MNTNSHTQVEQRLRAAVSGLNYPRTPDVSRAVRIRIAEGPVTATSLKVRVAAFVLVLLVAALAVPQVRARIIEFFQIGVIRVLPTLSTETPASPDPSIMGIPSTATPDIHQPVHIVSIAGLAGETTLDEAESKVWFPVLLPTYPADLGAPDRVFVQEDGPMVILVWLDESDPDKARLSLHQIGPQGFFIKKYEPRVIVETDVDGKKALWVEGPYMVSLTNGHEDFRRIVDGNTLIWQDGVITYRLESLLTLEEALKIAEFIE